jgi:hypothetical protein
VKIFYLKSSAQKDSFWRVEILQKRPKKIVFEGVDTLKIFSGELSSLRILRDLMEHIFSQGVDRKDSKAGN